MQTARIPVALGMRAVRPNCRLRGLIRRGIILGVARVRSANCVALGYELSEGPSGVRAGAAFCMSAERTCWCYCSIGSRDCNMDFTDPNAEYKRN